MYRSAASTATRKLMTCKLNSLSECLSMACLLPRSVMQPRFVSKKEREELALKRREEEAAQQRLRYDEMRRRYQGNNVSEGGNGALVWEAGEGLGSGWGQGGQGLI